jgi:nucleotide-binding universal stress UspA family protein
MSRTIVVGVNGLGPSNAALKWATARASLGECDLLIVHVVDDAAGAMSASELNDESGQAQQMLDECTLRASEQRPDVRVRSRLLTGDVVIELAAASERATMLVIGTNKTGFINGTVFGGRSLQIAAAATAPVVIVPEVPRQIRKGILVGVDDSPVGRAAIKFGAQEAELRRQPLTLLHGGERYGGDRYGGDRYGGDRPGASSDWTSDASSERSRLQLDILAKALVLARRHTSGEIRTRRLSRPAAEALLDASSSAEAVVVGCSRRTGQDRNILGSVSHDLIINCRCPTIVIHESGRFVVSTAPARLTLVGADDREAYRPAGRRESGSPSS